MTITEDATSKTLLNFLMGCFGAIRWNVNHGEQPVHSVSSHKAELSVW
jgi:hypothetical protein